MQGRIVKAREYGDRDDLRTAILVCRRFLRGCEHVVTARGVDRQHPGSKVRGGPHRRGDGAGDVVVLEIEKDSMSVGDHVSNQGRTLGAEELTPDLEPAGHTLELVAQIKRTRG